MIKSLFTNRDYNKRFLQILEIQKIERCKNGSKYIGTKGNPMYNDIKKKARSFKTQNNFLTLKLSTV